MLRRGQAKRGLASRASAPASPAEAEETAGALQVWETPECNDPMEVQVQDMALTAAIQRCRDQQQVVVANPNEDEYPNDFMTMKMLFGKDTNPVWAGVLGWNVGKTVAVDLCQKSFDLCNDACACVEQYLNGKHVSWSESVVSSPQATFRPMLTLDSMDFALHLIAQDWSACTAEINGPLRESLVATGGAYRCIGFGTNKQNIKWAARATLSAMMYNEQRVKEWTSKHKKWTDLTNLCLWPAGYGMGGILFPDPSQAVEPEVLPALPSSSSGWSSSTWSSSSTWEWGNGRTKHGRWHYGNKDETWEGHRQDTPLELEDQHSNEEQEQASSPQEMAEQREEEHCEYEDEAVSSSPEMAEAVPPYSEDDCSPPPKPSKKPPPKLRVVKKSLSKTKPLSTRRGVQGEQSPLQRKAKPQKPLSRPKPAPRKLDKPSSRPSSSKSSKARPSKQPNTE